MAIGQNLTQIIPDELFTELLVFWPSIWLIIVSFGLLTNGLIIRTFLRMGLDDCMTISFFALALSDFAQLFFPLASIVIHVLTYLESKFSYYFVVQPLLMFVYSSIVTSMFNNLTSYITTFLAVQRCLCIVKPFTFKGMFTNSLTWYIMSFLFLLSAVPTVVYICSYDNIKMVNPLTNRSQYVIITTPVFEYVNFYLQTIFFMTLNISSQALIFGTMIVMVYGLKASAKFRKDATAVGKKPQNRSGDETRTHNDDTIKTDSDRQNISKERAAIAQVALLCVIYLITTTPKLGVAITFQIVPPSFGLGGIYENMYRTTIGIRVTCDYINSAVNFWVYFRYNSKFRKLCFSKPQSKRCS